MIILCTDPELVNKIFFFKSNAESPEMYADSGSETSLWIRSGYVHGPVEPPYRYQLSQSRGSQSPEILTNQDPWIQEPITFLYHLMSDLCYLIC